MLVSVVKHLFPWVDKKNKKSLDKPTEANIIRAAWQFIGLFVCNWIDCFLKATTKSCKSNAQNKCECEEFIGFWGNIVLLRHVHRWVNFEAKGIEIGNKD